MAPLTTSSVMVSLALWLLWNCRPALYSWGLRGDKRPFNSERREVTEKEALREGYQSDIHHTNLSLGTGPARERPWRWSWACMCASVWGWGDTAHMGWWLQGREEERGGTGLLRCPSCHGAERRGVEHWCWGGEFGATFLFLHVSLLSMHLFSGFLFLSAPSFPLLWLHFSSQCINNHHKWSGRSYFDPLSHHSYSDSIGAPTKGPRGSGFVDIYVQYLNSSFHYVYITELKVSERERCFTTVYKQRKGADAHFRC